MVDASTIVEDLHQLDYVADGFAKNKVFGAIKDAQAAETAAPVRGPLASVLTELLVNKLLPDLIDKYGPELASVFVDAGRDWLKRKVGPPTAA